MIAGLGWTLACQDPPQPTIVRPPSDPDSTAPISTSNRSPAAPAPPIAWDTEPDVVVEDWVCFPAREPDYAEWPGGQRMRLDLGPFGGASLTATLTGADPGERIEIAIGFVCALDCPDPNGGCFQPASSEILAEVFADETGAGSTEMVPRKYWSGAWVVVQASAPDAAERYVSQPVVDHSGPFPGALLPAGLLREVAPVTLRGLRTELNEDWSWAIPPGRKASLTAARGFGVDVSARIVANGTTDPTEWGVDTLERTHLSASRWSIATGPLEGCTSTYDPASFAMDLRLLPADAPLAWYADQDADGYGDPAAKPVLSSVPVRAASTDASDCDDGDPLRHPWANETCDDGIDQDCDGGDRLCRATGAIDLAAGSVGTRLVGRSEARIGWGATVGRLDAGNIDDLVLDPTPDYSTARPNLIVTPNTTDVRAEESLSSPPAYAMTSGVGAILGPVPDDLVTYRHDGTGAAVLVYDGLGDWVPEFGLRPAEPEWPTGAWIIADKQILVQTATNGVYLFDTFTGDVQPQTSFVTAFPVQAVGDLDADGVDDVIDTYGCTYYGPGPFTAGGCLDLRGVVVADTIFYPTQLIVGVLGDDLYVLATPLTTDNPSPAAVVQGVGFDVPQIFDGGPPVFDYDRVFGGRRDATGELVTVAFPEFGGGTWSFAEVGQIWATGTGTGSRIAGGDFDHDGYVDRVFTDTSADYADRLDAGMAWILWSADAL